MKLEGFDIDNALIDEVNSIKEEAVKALLDGLLALGARCVEKGLASGRYKNRSGALRSSIGCAVGVNGRVHAMAGFAQVLGGSDGVTEGKALAKGLIEQSKGIALYVVAGKYYASYVEARGFDVLDTSELIFEKELERIVKELGFEIV